MKQEKAKKTKETHTHITTRTNTDKGYNTYQQAYRMATNNYTACATTRSIVNLTIATTHSNRIKTIRNTRNRKKRAQTPSSGTLSTPHHQANNHA